MSSTALSHLLLHLLLLSLILKGLAGDAANMDVGDGQQWGGVLETVTKTLQSTDLEIAGDGARGAGDTDDAAGRKQ
jgi:hypothetical protein